MSRYGLITRGCMPESGRGAQKFIPLNEIPGARFTRSRDEDMDEFVRRLQAKSVSTTIRHTRGNDIDAACGQLAAGGWSLAPAP